MPDRGPVGRSCVENSSARRRSRSSRKLLSLMGASDRFRYTNADILTVEGGLPEAFPR
jgi:hypothetical protein